MPQLALPRRITITTALIGNIALLTLVIGALCAWLMAQWGREDIHKAEEQRLALTAGGKAAGTPFAMPIAHRFTCWTSPGPCVMTQARSKGLLEVTSTGK